jgi:asparagine synthase (glutamine-hydrolysing)
LPPESSSKSPHLYLHQNFATEPDRLWGDPNLVYETDHLAFREIKSALYSDQISDIFPDFDCLEHLPVSRDKLRGLHPVHRRSYLDFKLRLVDHLVSDHGDRMAMANSVEARFPFLDTEVVAFATALPPDLKLRGWEEKYILKKVSAGKMPDSIVAREKFGFHAPGSPYLLKLGRDFIGDQLSPDRIRRQGYFNPETVEAVRSRYLADDFRLNLPFETDLLFVVLSFCIFLDEFSMPDFN